MNDLQQHNERVIESEFWLDPDGHLGDEMPILENGITGQDVQCPGCEVGMAEWYIQPIDPAGNPFITTEGWRCFDCHWEQEATKDDYIRTQKDRKRQHDKEFEERVRNFRATYSRRNKLQQ